jgi:glycine/D-amino acid oxidase-like deaminating enzyme
MDDPPPVDPSPRRLPPHRVVIIGGGATGLLTSVLLAEAGCAVTVLEKKHLGNGSTSRSAACIRSQFSVRETALGLWWATRFYEQFHTRLEASADMCRLPVICQNGYLFLYEDGSAEAALRWADAQTAAMMHRTIGLPVEVLDPCEVRRRWPHIVPDRLLGATWGPTDGFLYPASILAIAEARARALGVCIVQNTEVIGAKQKGNTISSVVVQRGSGVQDDIPADVVINATNAWAPRVARVLGGMNLRVSPLKRYLYFVTRPENGFSPEAFERLPMTIYGMTANRGAYSRPDGQSQLMLGWAHSTPPEPNFSDEDQDKIGAGFSHKSGTDNYGVLLLQNVWDFVPTLVEHGGLVGTTGGYYADTPDHTMLIGYDGEITNLLHGVGCSGHGLMHAPYTAKILLELVAAGEPIERMMLESDEVSLAAFSPSRTFKHAAESAVI